MSVFFGNFLICLIELTSFIFICGCALQENKSLHYMREDNIEKSLSEILKHPSYRSFRPISIKYHKNVCPRRNDQPDYDITSYDTEYGGVFSNLTSSIYDDNPPLYPNPEFLTEKKKDMLKIANNKLNDEDLDIPDDSLADADLKEHNIIDCVTYIYGYINCHEDRNEWMILIFVSSIMAILLLVAAIMWLMWSEYAGEFRCNSKLYPININLCCCLIACMLIYIQAVAGISSPTKCEKVALVLHYTHICCAIWIVALAAAVAEYCACDTVLPLKYNYLLAYGVPAIVVMFNYALSMEHYEIKHYCWMSIEKGMVMGFMVPVMILIIINIIIVILGLQSVNKKQAEMLTAKIEELLDHHIANWPKEQNEGNKNSSVDTLQMYTPGSSRKNTDSSDNLDEEYYLSEEECQQDITYVIANCNKNAEGSSQIDTNRTSSMPDKNLLSMVYMEIMSCKWSWNAEGNELKTYLHLCLVLEPLFAINWVMGVVVIENATQLHAIYMILVIAMYMTLTVTLCTTLPIVRDKSVACCEDLVVKPPLTAARTTDSIPLLDPSVQQPNLTPAPVDTISTISI